MSGLLSRLVGALIGVAVGSLLLWFAFRGTDVSSVTSALAAGHWSWPALGVLSGTCLFVYCKVARWRLLLGQTPATFLDLLYPTTSGLALNALIPHSGEFVRAVSLNRRYGQVTSAVLASIVTERVFDLFAVLLLAAAALSSVALPAALSSAVRWVAILAVAGSLVIIAVLVLPEAFRQLARRLTGWLPRQWSDGLLREVDAAVEGLMPVRHGSTAIRVLLWSLLQWLAIALCAACSVSVVGDAISIGGALLVVVGIVVAFLLPNAPGYAGSVQLAFVMALSASDISPAHAIAASVVYQCLMIGPLVVLGLVWLRRSLTPRREP